MQKQTETELSQLCQALKWFGVPAIVCRELERRIIELINGKIEEAVQIAVLANSGDAVVLKISQLREHYRV
jgi:hypothetical protein